MPNHSEETAPTYSYKPYKTNEIRKSHEEQLLMDFPGAIKEGQFRICFQPKFDIRMESPVLIGAETLVRWEHPKFGMIYPQGFFPTLLKYGKVREMNAYIWKETAKRIREIQDRFNFTVPVSINVSRADLYEERLADELLSIVGEAGIKPKDMPLEISEFSCLENTEQIAAAMKKLGKAGFKIEIDDVGSGCLPLKAISILPFDSIKLDMRFVGDALEGSEVSPVPDLMFAIAAIRNASVVAEGVETEDQLHALKLAGCVSVQGFYLKEPVPLKEFETLLENRGDLKDVYVSESAKPSALKQNLACRDVPFGKIAQALAAGFKEVYYIDTETNHYQQFSTTGRYADLSFEGNKDDFFADVTERIEKDVYYQDKIRVGLLMRKGALMSKLSGSAPFTITYRLMVDGHPKWHKIKAVRVEERDNRHIVVGIVDIDAQISRDQDYVADSGDKITYTSIAQSLAADFFTIYYVDTDTDNFIEFSSYDEYHELGIEQSGDDFFNALRKNVPRVIYPDDQQKVLRVLTKENIMAELKQNNTFSLSYRLMFGDEPSYVYLKAMPMLKKEDSHIVIGVSRVDAQMRMEKEFAEELENAKMLANRDALTGVKSKYAYSETEKRFNRLIEVGDSLEFAVAVCDVNDLKDINDSLGHKAGDEYIMQACRNICETFKHSPVFRVGGDEFVVIMQGSDYENREELLEKLTQINLESTKNGGVVVAIGISELAFGKDTALQQVFDRADSAMYRNKKYLKGETK